MTAFAYCLHTSVCACFCFVCIQRFAFGIVMIHLASNNVATHLYLSFIQHQHIDTPRTDLCCVYACAFYVRVSGCVHVHVLSLCLRACVDVCADV